MCDNKKNIEQYSIYVNTIIANENRRQQVSVVYISLVSAGLTLIKLDYISDNIYILRLISLISIVWFLQILYFRRLAKAKFYVIRKIEQQWDLKPFYEEWEYMERSKILSKMRLRLRLTHLEAIIPVLIFICSIILQLPKQWIAYLKDFIMF